MGLKFTVEIEIEEDDLNTVVANAASHGGWPEIERGDARIGWDITEHDEGGRVVKRHHVDPATLARAMTQWSLDITWGMLKAEHDWEACDIALQRATLGGIKYA